MSKFDEVLAELVEEPKRSKYRTGYRLYPRLLITESGDITYQHEDFFVVGIMDET